MTNNINYIIKAISQNKKVYILFYKHSLNDSAREAYAHIMLNELNSNTIVGNTEFSKIDVSKHSFSSHLTKLYRFEEFDKVPFIICFENKTLTKKIAWTRKRGSQENNYSVQDIFPVCLP